MPLDREGGLPLGILEGQTYEQAHVALEPRDLLLLYTDGITEAMAPLRGERRDLFGVGRLDQLLLGCSACSAADCIADIRTRVAAFSEGAPPTYDQTLIAIRCL